VSQNLNLFQRHGFPGISRQCLVKSARVTNSWWIFAGKHIRYGHFKLVGIPSGYVKIAIENGDL